MKLTLLFFSALSCGYIATAAKIHPVVDQVSATFKSDATPSESAETSAFVGQCLMSAFNKAHSADDYSFETAELESESVGPGDRLRGNLGYGWDIGYMYVIHGYCRWCWGDDEDPNDDRLAGAVEHNFAHWEANFCECLQDSSDPALQTATDCKFDLTMLEETKENDASIIIVKEEIHPVVDQVSATFKSDATPSESAETSAFVGQCLMSAFNKAHSADDYSFETAELESESVGPGDRLRGNLGYGWDIGYMYVIHGYCRWCWGDDKDPNDDRLAGAVEHNFAHWEANFCECLQDSSDPALQTATDCKFDLMEIDATVVFPKKVSITLLNSASVLDAQNGLRGSSPRLSL